ncbi:hypothetical protein PGB90_005249 [Kerria lacca]
MPLWGSNINLNSCIWFEIEDNKRNATASIIAGLLFFVGWWLMIDANVVHPDLVSTGYYVWGTLGTISLIMVNLISRSQIHGDSSGGYFDTNVARAWLFVGFVLGFASVIASFGIFFANFFPKDISKTPGIELFLQNILIFLSSIIYKFGRTEEESF